LHSLSPLQPTAPTESVGVASLETELADENLDAATLDERFEDVLNERVIETVIEAIAGENAVVTVTVEFAASTEKPEQFLVAPESGEWRIVTFR
jgi:hypothetical protein